MPPRAGSGPSRCRAKVGAQRAGRLLLLVVVTAALTPGIATDAAEVPQLDASILVPNSFVNLSNPAQLAAYARSQGLPPDANVTRPCGCECLPHLDPHDPARTTTVRGLCPLSRLTYV